ncbi:nucleotidyltransferase domain-containing protein [Nocardiopsis alba]|uniref:nucleotidyltransferase domain-containing protein n=1 Tax=Nocardiopsis alba TaxID=53437 RepID=UPI0005AA9D42|nr:hypothetical protein [Nocardiopsis alba]
MSEGEGAASARTIGDPWGPWDPLSPREVADLFEGVASPWWISGGHAIEFAVGHRFRPHEDIDVLLLRRDRHVVQEVLADWEWWAADPPGTLRPWRVGETLPPRVHDIWCRPGPSAPWRLQFMLDAAEGDDWVYRRDGRIRLPVARLGGRSPDGIPYQVPEIPLLYKARGTRAKDERDFSEVLPVLGSEQRRWLAEALSLVHDEHPWIDRLRMEGC